MKFLLASTLSLGLLLGAAPHALAKKSSGANLKAAAMATSGNVPQRIVRDHRNPCSSMSGGVRVSKTGSYGDTNRPCGRRY